MLDNQPTVYVITIQAVILPRPYPPLVGLVSHYREGLLRLIPPNFLRKTGIGDARVLSLVIKFC